MVHTRQYLRFANHTRHRHFIATTRQHFHGKMPTVTNTLDIVHDPHGALAEVPGNSISIRNHRSRLERRPIFTDELVVVVHFIVTQR